MSYSPLLVNLIESLRCMPGVGRKSAQRIAFHLYYIEEWTIPEIAEVLDCRAGTVKSHLNRAREKVKKDREVLQWQMRSA